MTTPYWSGVPTNLIAKLLEADDSPSLKHCKEAYQGLIGSIGWFAHSTCPNLITAHSFLASYSNKPSTGHMKVALHTLHYIHSMHNYSISFTSKNVGPMHSFIHYLPTTDVETYIDATPPTANNLSTLSSYSDACWGLQIGSTVANGTLFPLFKFRSMSSVNFFQKRRSSWLD